MLNYMDIFRAINISTPISATLSANPASLCQGGNVVLTTIVSGGNFNYIYSWGQGIPGNSPGLSTISKLPI